MSASEAQEVSSVIAHPSLSPAFLSPPGGGKLKLTKWRAGRTVTAASTAGALPMHQPLMPVEGGSCWILCQAISRPTGWQRGFGLKTYPLASNGALHMAPLSAHTHRVPMRQGGGSP